MKTLLITGCLATLTFCSCNNNTTEKKSETPVTGKDTVRHEVISKDSILSRLTDSILNAVVKQDYQALAGFIDPVQGVRFSPYGYIDTANHLVFSKEKLIAQGTASTQEKMTWGSFDGTGDPIVLTANEYLKKFVFDVDFLHPETRKMNEFLGHGNSLNNLLAIYKGCDFIESYFSGFDKKYGGMDWRSLRLVFRNSAGRFWLVAVVHDQWTS